MPEVCVIDWHLTPFRRDEFLAGWTPACERAPAFGAHSWSLTRSEEDPLHIRQTIIWESRSDFQRYWTSEEVAAARAEVLPYFDKPLHPTWHALLASE